ncbi:hypothetical protein N656DRAFT_167288 [Canariomyces notabilis]|uniref:Uncharacterized protein n=1 Tax=Canariomyces notabilis TaxID=2074819 RepID=A0AAN6QJL5_9PEZI|nr:hypothetical protein N656DRAFT_167288 [Canariomyces arenarius]
MPRCQLPKHALTLCTATTTWLCKAGTIHKKTGAAHCSFLYERLSPRPASPGRHVEADLHVFKLLCSDMESYCLSRPNDRRDS